MNLLIPVKIGESTNIMDRKYTTSVSLGLAEKLANEFNIELSNFVHFEKES